MVGLNNASSNGEINEKLVSVVQQTAIFFAQLSDVVYRVGASFAILGNNIGAVAAMAASLASGDLAGALAIDAAADKFNDDFKFTLGLADAVEKKFAEINKQAATARAVFNDPRRLGEVGTIAEQTLANNGKTLSFSGSAKSEGVTKAALSEYDKLIQKLGVELPKAAAEAEAAQNGYNKSTTFTHDKHFISFHPLGLLAVLQQPFLPHLQPCPNRSGTFRKTVGRVGQADGPLPEKSIVLICTYLIRKGQSAKKTNFGKSGKR